MQRFYAFNGDADGLCALQQLVLAEGAADRRLVSGPKRQTALLRAVEAAEGDAVTVLDVSLATNRGDVERLLGEGASVRYFDHHHPGAPLAHPRLEAHIDTSPAMCTSAIVDRYLGGAARRWAVVGAYGDNLDATAERLARELGLPERERPLLRTLGIALNYNSYADGVEDMFFEPVALHRALAGHRDPLSFARESREFAVLTQGYAADMERIAALSPSHACAHAAVFVLPAESWARRAVGAFANQLAQRAPERAHAVLVPNGEGGMLVSVRAPSRRPLGAAALCLSYPGGGGREAAAGINHLAAGDLEAFVARFFEHFKGAVTT